MTSARARLTWTIVWSLAFGVVEGAVVTYLRRIFYAGKPLNGPLFPLRVGDGAVLATEVAREAATIVMLLGAAMLAERRGERRFAAFSVAFGCWDLAYYAMLWLALRWPHSVMEWDILFLIPAAWASPVLAPVLVSLALIGCGALVMLRQPDDAPALLRRGDWLALVAGGLLILASFFWNTPRIARLEPPGDYPWWLFAPGLVLALAAFARAWRASGMER